MAELKAGWEKLPSKRKNEIIKQLLDSNKSLEDSNKELNSEVQKGFKLLKQTEKMIVDEREKIIFLMGYGRFSYEEAVVLYTKANAPLAKFYEEKAK